MKKILTIVCLFILLLFAGGCKTQQPAPQIEYIERVNTIEKTVVKKDTVTVTLPMETSHNETTDTTSTVETSLAKSTASYIDGKLIHNIWNKPQLSIPVDVPHTYTSNDSIIYREKVVKVEVERNFTTTEKIKMDAFWWLILGCAVMVCWLCRNPILKLFGKFVKFV